MEVEAESEEEGSDSYGDSQPGSPESEASEVEKESEHVGGPDSQTGSWWGPAYNHLGRMFKLEQR